MINLVHNEMLKLIRKKRIVVVLLILVVLIPIFTYAQFKVLKTTEQRLGTTDWRTSLQQQIVDTQNRMNSSRISDEFKRVLQVRLAQQQYYLQHDINPTAPGAPTFMRFFGESASSLLLPLLIMIVSADIVSSEQSSGTMKLLLTRPVRRWKVLLSKYITMVLAISFIIFSVATLCYVISGLVFGYSGWGMPVLTGFTIENGQLRTDAVRLMPQWLYLLMEYGLVWFVCLVVGTLSFMLSVLIRGTAAGMGVMLATIIAGVILVNMVSSWESAKYLFNVNLNLTSYLSGNAPPIEGMSLPFSITVLSMWGLAGLIVSFAVFTRKDMY